MTVDYLDDYRVETMDVRMVALKVVLLDVQLVGVRAEMTAEWTAMMKEKLSI